MRPPALLALAGLLAVPFLRGNEGEPASLPLSTQAASDVAATVAPTTETAGTAARRPSRRERPRAPGRAGELRVVPVRDARLVPAGVVTYAVEVEGRLRVDPVRFAAIVRRTLGDPRGWSGGAGPRFRRVGAPDADLRIALASPALADALCQPLLTNGIFSCAAGNRAVLNVARWQHGADSYAGEPLSRYRIYMVNHEVGHLLGHAHAYCPAPGERAPLMMQQTKGTDGCRPNPWPLPSERA